MRATPRVQTVDKALEIFGDAEKKGLPINCDERANIVMHSADSLSKGVDPREGKQRAIREIVRKMEKELESLARATGKGSAADLMQKLPGLGRFAASGMVGDLRQQWQKLTTDQAQQRSAVAEQRQRIVSEFRYLLPDIPIRFEPDGTAIMYQDFSAPEHQRMIAEDIVDSNKYELNRDGVYHAHAGDVHRTFWKIEVDTSPAGSPPQAEMVELGLSKEHEEQAQRKRAALKNLVDNDATALGTVSKLIHQGTLFTVSRASHILTPSNPNCLMRSEIPNEASTFFRIARKGDNLEFECNAFYRVDWIERYPTADDPRGKRWRVNAFGNRSDPPGLDNYGSHVRLRVLIDMEAARKGELRPVQGSQIDASVEHRIRPELQT